jgi:hypothetical protein
VVVRAAAVLALAAAFAAYSEFAEHLPALPDWGDVAFLSILLFPAMFALVWLALPLRDFAAPHVLGGVALAFAALAAVLDYAELDILANFAKLAAATAVGWWFLTFFEAVWWVLLVAVLIIPVDIFSVARGPTREITENQPQVFDALSVFFRIPGEHTAAQLGLTDVLFFALFLGAAARFGLRARSSWVAMTLSFGGTVALAVALQELGVAALPLLSAAFVLVNADLLVRALRRRNATE